MMRSCLETGASRAPSEALSTWLVPGVLVSVALHFGAAAYYLHQPMPAVEPPPAAIPVSVALVAPLAAPRAEQPSLNTGPKQQETQDAQAAVARPQSTEVKPEESAPTERKPPVPHPIPPKVLKPNPIKAPEASRASDLAAATPQRKKTVERKPKPADNPAPEQSKLSEDMANKPKQPVNQSASVAQVEQSSPQLDVDNQQQQVQGVSGAFSQQIKQLQQNWKQTLVLHLEQHKQYPRRAKRLRHQGTPLVSFTMDRSGRVLGAKLVRSSGTDALDKEALDLVYRAMPLPLPPKEVVGETLTWTVPVRFYVQ